MRYLKKKHISKIKCHFANLQLGNVGGAHFIDIKDKRQ